MTIRSIFRKIKIRARTLLFISILTFLEVIALLGNNDWKFTWVAFIPLIQFVLIFERKDIWNKLSQVEKEKVLISEDTLTGLVLGVEKLLQEGDSVKKIIKKIKED